MSERILSIFIDESGDFGSYLPSNPYYLVAMVLHDQHVDISHNIHSLDDHLRNLGYDLHAIHTGPLIRRESDYGNDLMERRKQLFNALFHFARKLDFHYFCIRIKKSECPDIISMASKLSKSISSVFQAHSTFLEPFNHIIVYYDNGQIELTKILVSVFHALHPHVEFRKVQPVDYKLFQVADLVCTMELLAEKASQNTFSCSEQHFFLSIRNFKKNYLKYIRAKQL